jgi:hypothetical protein
MDLKENAKELLQICLKSIHDLSRRYFFQLFGDESIPGTLSFLLSVKEADLIKIFSKDGVQWLANDPTSTKKKKHVRTIFLTPDSLRKIWRM